MYDFKRNSEDEYLHIVDLYRLCFNIKTNVNKIKTKYNTSSFGFSNIGFFAVDSKNERAAYYGVFPLKIKIDKNLVNAAQSGDTMTSPNHQKKGLFVLLANATYDLCKKCGINLVFGFPNQNSYPGFVNKLGWKFFGNMQKFEINIKTLPFSEIAYRVGYFKKLYNKYVYWYLNQFQLLEDIDYKGFNYPESQFMVYKDDSFFKYKMENSDCRFVKYNGNIYFLKVDGHLLIGDIQFRPDFNIVNCISDLKKIGKILCCRKIVFYVSENHWLFPHLTSVLNHEMSLPIGFKFIDKEIDGKNFKFSAVDFDTF